MSITELAKRYRDLEAKHEELSKQLKELSTEWNDCEQLIIEAFIEEGVNSVKLEGLGHFILNTKNYLSVPAANKELYFDYLRKSGNDGILKLDVNPKTNGAFLDKHLEIVIQYFMDKKGLDKVDARKSALEYLSSQGVSYFSEKRIAVRKA